MISLRRSPLVYLAATLSLGMLSLGALSASAKPTQTLVAFRSTAPALKGRFISAKPRGGLILGSTGLGNKEVFTLIDLNGGALRDGDLIQMTYAGKHPTYWCETPGHVSRTGGKPDKNCAFKVKWKQTGKVLLLHTASGKWVSGPGKGQDMAAISKAGDPTLAFELLKNPKIESKPAPKAAPKAAQRPAKK